MAEILSSSAAAILQWWLWILGPAILVLAWIRVTGDRRAAMHDVLLRALVAGEFALLIAGVWLSFATSPERGDRVFRPDPPPFTAPPAAMFAGSLVEDEPSPAPDPRRAAATNDRWRLPSLIAFRAGLGWPAWASGLVLAAYAAGCAIGLRSLVREARRVSALRRVARPIVDPRIRAPIPCFLCDDAPGVLLTGWRNLMILIAPALLDRLSAAQLRALIAHEIAHRVRHDIAWQLAARILSLITWPILVNRSVLRRMRFAAEVLCDRYALDGEGDAEAYASMLAEAAARPVPLAAEASAKSFLRRRVEMVLASSLRSARAGALARAGAVLAVLALLLLPVACLRVAARGPQADPRLLEPAAAAPAAKAEPSPEVKAAQKALAESWVAQARAQYAAAEYDKAKASLREAFASDALCGQVVPLAEGVAALGLGPALPHDALLQDPGAPFLMAYVEQRYGPFDVASPGAWVDEDAAILVQARPLIERIQAEILAPGKADQAIAVGAEIFALEPAAARMLAQSLGLPGTEDFRRALAAGEGKSLDAAIGDAKSGIQRMAAPSITCRDREQACIVVCSRTTYVEKYRLVTKGSATVADPVVSTVNSGIAVEVLPVIEEGDAISIGLRAILTELKGMKEARIDLPNAADVPIGIPDLETTVHTVAIRLKDKDEILLALGELTPDEVDARKVHWLKLKAERVAMPPKAE